MIVYGIPAISRAIGFPIGRTKRLIAAGQMPGVFREGGRWACVPSVVVEGYARKARHTKHGL